MTAPTLTGRDHETTVEGECMPDCVACRVERLEAEVERLRAVVDDLKKLMAESRGVDGLHLNGDVAEWDWLINNGWLDSLRPRDSEEAPDAR